MKIGLFLTAYWIRWCFGAKLNPLENNDKLKDINSNYVSEWQWELWPVKQGSSEEDVRSPGARVNVALWEDSSKRNWYLFGGQPADSESRKIYSDLWKYTVGTRVWDRLFPARSEVKGTNEGKVGEMMTLRASLFPEGVTQNDKPKNYHVILCGHIVKKNSTKAKKPSIWENSSRRKKFEEKEEKPAELKSLAIYSPRSTKSNTVWQMDMKDKLWTAYVCCCDTSTDPGENSTTKPTPKTSGSTHETATKKSFKAKESKGPEKDESSVIELKIDQTEDEVDAEQQHLSINNLKNKKKKINTSKKENENTHKKSKEIEKRSTGEKEGNGNETKAAAPDKGSTIADSSTTTGTTTTAGAATAAGTPTTSGTTTTASTLVIADPTLGPEKNNTKISKKEKYNSKLNVNTNKTESPVRHNYKNVTAKPKMASKYCPEFAEDAKPVTWCDGNNEALVTTDISSPRIVLWIFNLRTSHWSQEEVNQTIDWQGCLDATSMRYAGTEDEVYIICSSPKTHNSSKDASIHPNNLPSKSQFTVKLVYRINYKSRVLESLGELLLPFYFGTPDGIKIWQNDMKCILQVIRTPDNKKLLMLAYEDTVNLWILTKDNLGRYYFDYIEKLWRGSALKWFKSYNAPLYNIQFTSESGESETILIPNPRGVHTNEYWHRERGRFIVRIFKNEYLRNETSENRTWEQNLTYEPFQTDLPDHAVGIMSMDIHKLLHFLMVVGVLTAVLLVSVKGWIRNMKRGPCAKYSKSPIVVKYSVVPENIRFPVA